MQVTSYDIKTERLLMLYEELKTGKMLLVGTGESEAFWNKERYAAGNRWYHPWSNKSDLEIVMNRNKVTKTI